MPCEIPVRVVSLPAKMKSSKKFEYSVSSSRSPSTSAWTTAKRGRRSGSGRSSPIVRPYSET